MSVIDAGTFRTSLVELLKELYVWKDGLEKEIPRKWEKYDDLILFTEPCFTHDNWFLTGEVIWEHVCRLLKVQRIAIKGTIKNNGFRSPQVRIIYGDSSMASCTDNGIKYTWDIQKSMFSPGNVTERHRIAKLDCHGEVIVDLFAGIGYFVLPYLVHAGAKFVHACEWNPDAIKALRCNLELNKVNDRCQIYEGDCREVCPEGIANRVNLGLIPSSELGWLPACRALVLSGGILYVHQNVTTGTANSTLDCPLCSSLLDLLHLNSRTSVALPPVEVSPAVTSGVTCKVLSDAPDMLWKKFGWFSFSLHLSHIILDILISIHSQPWAVSAKEVHRIKSYAPHIDHLVIALECHPVSKSDV